MKYFRNVFLIFFCQSWFMLKWVTHQVYTGRASEKPPWQWLSLIQCLVRYSPVYSNISPVWGSMTTISRIAILCVPSLLLLLLLIQFDIFHQDHLLSLGPVLPTHPDVILSDPGGPLLVSMAEVVMIPPPVIPQPTCSPPKLPRLGRIPSSML